MYDAIILSDIHLGSENCQAKNLCQFLDSLDNGELMTARLILNGDMFDSIDFRRLKKHHWNVLSMLRKLSDHIEIIWICGNHDGPAEVVSPLLGVTVENEYILESGSERILILHGHIFDEFIDAHPLLTFWGDCIYAILQTIDKTHAMPRWIKRSSKTFLRCAEKIEVKSIEMARRKNCTAVCCGHTHHAIANRVADPSYFNSGCWTELPSHYIAVRGGRIDVCAYDPSTVASNQEVAEPILLPS